MITNNFCIESHRDTCAALQRLARHCCKKRPPERITRESLREYGAIALGDFLVADCDKLSSLYTTDADCILGRAPLPLTGGVVWFEGNRGITHQLNWVVGLHRLHNIAQLSLLGYPVKEGPDNDGLTNHSVTFNHTRLVHTFDVVAIGLIMAYNCGVRGKELTALRIALAIHDLFTPAGGDLIKFIDYERFDEDARLSELLNNAAYVQMCVDLSIEPSEPIRICQEKDGVLCKIRDAADTIAYTARDLDQFLPQPWQDCPDDWYIEPEEQILLELLFEFRKESNLLNLWSDVRSNSAGELVFANAEKLHTFLFIRASMFRLLYYNKQTRAIEYILGIRLIKVLLEERKLSLDELEGDRSSDSELWFSKVYGITGYNPGYMHNGGLGFTREFYSFENARRYVEKVSAKKDDVCGVIYTWPSATKSKVNYWRVEDGSEDGSEDGIPWGEAYPEEALEIERHMQLHSGYFVSIFKRDELHQIHDSYWAKLKKLEHNIL